MLYAKVFDMFATVSTIYFRPIFSGSNLKLKGAIFEFGIKIGTKMTAFQKEKECNKPLVNRLIFDEVMGENVIFVGAFMIFI